MAVLANSRHELFAQGVATGKPAREAYIAAGYSPNGADGAASKLQSIAKVFARINELKSEAAKGAVLTIEGLTADLLRIAGKAEQLAEASGLSVARASIMDAAKLNGLVVDKSEGKGDMSLTLNITRKIVSGT